MKACLVKLKAVADVGFVGGSDQKKIRQQLDEDTIQLSNYFFSQNGLVALRGSELIGKTVCIVPHRQSKISWENQN